MVTVRLSIPDIALPAETSALPSSVSAKHGSNDDHSRKSFDILFESRTGHTSGPTNENNVFNEEKVSLDEQQQHMNSEPKDTYEEGEANIACIRTRSDSTSSDVTTGSNEVDWTELTKTEESELKDEGTDEVRLPLVSVSHGQVFLTLHLVCSFFTCAFRTGK